MAADPEQPSGSESASRRSMRTVWTTWLIVIAALAGLAVLGGWLIGLPPGYTIALVAALAVASFGWIFVVHRRRSEAVAMIGIIGRVVVTGAVLLVVIQAIPTGRDHSDAPVTGEPAWSSPRTRELTVDACYGCHSNEVEWPWYSNVAPMSWAISSHVDEGRDAVNYSEFATNPGDAEESIQEILDGSMPPTYYTRFGLHSAANLSPAERDELIAGLRATPGFAEDGGDDEGEDDDEDDDVDDDD